MYHLRFKEAFTLTSIKLSWLTSRICFLKINPSATLCWSVNKEDVFRWIPVVTVEVIEPAALLHQLNTARVIPPWGVTVRAFVLLILTSLHTAAIRLLNLPVDVKIQTFTGLHLAMTGSWNHTRDNVTINARERNESGWCGLSECAVCVYRHHHESYNSDGMFQRVRLHMPQTEMLWHPPARSVCQNNTLHASKRPAVTWRDLWLQIIIKI